jgi:hypothetical protein
MRKERLVNQLIQHLAATMLVLAALATVLSLVLTGRIPRPGIKTCTVLAIAFLLVITPKR